MRHLLSAVLAVAAVMMAPAPAWAQMVQPRQPNISRDGDPYSNGNHTLRDRENDPGDGWGADDPRIRGTGVRVDQAAGDWPWGELVYGKTYPAPLEITNKCDSTEIVSIFVNNLPYLNIQRFVSVPAKQTITVNRHDHHAGAAESAADRAREPAARHLRHH
jgi:hypothetical protein